MKLNENIEKTENIRARLNGDNVDFDGNADAYEKLADLEDEVKQLNKKLDARILQCEWDDLRKLADGIQKVLGGAAELRFAIYECLCHEEAGVHIPDFIHGFYQNHDPYKLVTSVDPDEPEPCVESYEERMERAKERMEEIRNRYIFNKEYFGDVTAKEIRQLYLGENVLHFRDAHAGWENDDDVDGPGQPEEDYPREEQRVYDKYRREITFIEKSSFAKKPKITLVIVSPFDRREAMYIEHFRIWLNFVEMVLPTYQFFRNNKSEVKVVEMGIEYLIRQEDWPSDEVEDLAWQVEMMDEAYAQSTGSHYTYPNARKTPQRTQLEERIKEVLAQRPESKEEDLI
ncbi:hypothetical protein PtrCC142_007760 [Pyrenophora tritici-repentis]|nr:hypothetical protein PtrSN001A_007738 [Pyrenophora tritici-repentis]KAI1533296.1 hypothetical protein PtrSN001C_007621 [Pyrenophora tritici-repentis]KAI1571598.1 hypothetical protein PtrEW7m1_007812 [Pyrenophora tritici-repentis]KAI1586142.1 hypothetical protein PtrEW13061_007699 [Pyrenophora tritici-repentis]KAI1598931.1 hypothetical protein PtrCC142_007760 [Pyrenophora tritici-repentis]